MTISTGYAELGPRLRAARNAAAMTEQTLARLIGVKAATISSWEQGRVAPRANRLQMIASVLNVSIGWLLNGEDSGDAPQRVETVSDAQAAAVAALREARALHERAAVKLASAEAALRALAS